MARILIAGCGYVGAATAELLHGRGWEVEGWTASADSAAQLAQIAAYPVRAVDLTDASAVEDAGGEFDVIIQSASSRGGGAEDYRRIYFESASHLTRTFPRAVLLFVSSTSVYAQTNGEWVTEEAPAAPERATARLLRETEELVLARAGMVARLAGIYGPGRSALLRKFLEGSARLGPDSDRFVNQVHRDDVATALCLLAESALQPAAADLPRIYNVSDNHPLSQRACYEWLAAHFQRPLPMLSDAAPTRKRGNSNKRVSSDKLQALGWSPRYPSFAEGMVASVLPGWTQTARDR
ncbi:MAG: NAD-dependent epimerase/dehydratase family protein [Chthoniobacterales bacterium]